MASSDGSFHCSQVASTSINEDAEFVEAVMATTITPHPVDISRDSRKRQLSRESDVCSTSSKKLKESEPTMGELAHLIVNLEKSMNDRMTQLEGRLMEKLRDSILAELDEVREGLTEQINTLKDRMSLMEDTYKSAPLPNDAQPNAPHRIVVINLQAHPIENVCQKVNTMLKEGLGLSDITVSSAERKMSRNDKPGVVIAECSSPEDLRKILERKTKLKECNRYKSVYINRDLPLAQRIHNANMRTIINTIGKDKLELKGNTIRQKSSSPSSRQSYSDAARHNDGNGSNRHPNENNHSNNNKNNSNNNKNKKSNNSSNNNGQNYSSRNGNSGSQNRRH